MRPGQSCKRRYLTPEAAAEAHRAEQDGNEYGKAAAADPIRQRHLRRQVETRQGGHPGRARCQSRQDGDARGVSEPESDQRDRGCEGRAGEQTVRAELRSGPGQGQACGHPRRPDGAEDCAVECGTAADLIPSEQRQQTPIRAGEDHESGGADQRGTKRCIEAGMAQACPQSAAEGLRR